MTIVKFQRGITQKHVLTIVMVPVVCTLFDDALCFYEVSRKYLKGFSL